MQQEMLWEMVRKMLQEMVRTMAPEIIRDGMDEKNLFNKAAIGRNLALEMG